MSKVIVIGEALIDFIPRQTGCELKAVEGFERLPGGAPANVAACVKKLGLEAQIITKLGMDAFGDFLVDTMKEAGINVESVYRTDEANTALAFISLKEDGEREFSFYRNPSADMLLEPEEIKEEWFTKGDVLHFCSVDLVDAPVRRAHDRAIAIAKEKGCMISFDPNVRLPLWNDHAAYAQVIRDYIPFADFIKVSDEELSFITGINDEQKAIEWLLEQVEMVVYTKGKDGACIYTRSAAIEDQGYPTQAIDTTGAGDAFIGAYIYGLLDGKHTQTSIHQLKEEHIKEILNISQAVASIVVTRKGAISAMPTKEEVMTRIGVS